VEREDNNSPEARRDAEKAAEALPHVGDSGISDDNEFVDSDPPLPNEGRDDPLTRGETTGLEKGVDPETGLPAARQALF
jgi:hypothetical protein